MQETFSAEIGDVHERGGARPPSFNDEFRGLSDTEIERLGANRGHRAGSGIGKTIAAVVVGMLVIAGTAVGGYFAFSELGPRMFGADVGDETNELPAAQEEPIAEPAQTPASGGAPSEAPPLADPSEPPTEAPPVVKPSEPPPAVVPAASVVADSTQVRGRVSTAAVDAHLKAVDQALDECWARAVEKGARGPAKVSLRFTIRWNRKATHVDASGDSLPAGIESCIEDALPRSGWPEPRDYGDASVTRSWSLTTK